MGSALGGPPESAEARSRDKELLGALRQGIETGDFCALETAYKVVGARWSQAGIDLKYWFELSDMFRARMLEVLFEHYQQPAQLKRAILGLQRYADNITRVVTREYVHGREALLLEQKRSAEDTLLRYRRLAESGIIGIFICDIYGHAKEANDGFLNMLGYSREELFALNWKELTPPEWSRADDEAVQQLQEHGRTATWEKEYFRKDGSRVPILVGVAMLNETDCIAFTLDITERKRLEALRLHSQELESQNSRMAAANRLKSEFLANMSHELRTPLNAIIGFSELLHDGEIAPDSPHHREFLGDILKSGHHLLQLINDVLDLSKVEAGKMDFRPEPTKMDRLVGEVCAVLRSVAAERRVTLRYQVDPLVSDVTLDPARLKQVLYNYASNAIKFTQPGGTVTIRARPEGLSSLCVEVVDDGIGIASKDIGRLFTEFQQLDPKRPGTGLGLALTKRMVEAQGGHVGVESGLGKGSRFFAVLPKHLPVFVSSLPPSVERPSVGGVVVLVVDDDEKDRAVVAGLLDSVGYAVEIAATGHAAIERCHVKTFDAITLDLLLPDISGLEVLHRLRTDGLNRETPIVVVSVVADDGVAGGFAVHDYLRKPLHGADLLASLSRAGVLPEASGMVLVVDDDSSSLKLMDVTLRNLGYDVVCSEDGAAALRATRRHRPLAVILDLLMPNMDGFEFLSRFRRVPENRNVPVIVWTVKDLTVSDRKRLNDMAQGVFAKGQGRPAAMLDELKSLLTARSPSGAPPYETG